MAELYLEDLKAGDVFESGEHLVTETEIVEFARRYDPQPFHLDRAAAEKSLFRGLAASGWLTAAITMKLYVAGMRLAQGSIGLGIDDLRWLKPVRPGDTLKARSEVLSIRSSRSKPGRGIARVRTVTTNQKGEAVQSFVATVLVWARPKTGN